MALRRAQEEILGVQDSFAADLNALNQKIKRITLDMERKRKRFGAFCSEYF